MSDRFVRVTEQFHIETEDGHFLCAVETEEDAHLIAAAPEMYEALIDIRSFLKSHGYDTRIVNAALAKAEGRS